MGRPFLIILAVVALVAGCGAHRTRGVMTVASVPDDTFGETGLAIDFFGVPLNGVDDIVFVVDRSGSMGEPVLGLDDMDLATLSVAGVDGVEGTEPRPPTKMEAARYNLLRAVNALPNGTRLNVIFFDHEVSTLAPRMVVLDPGTRASARAFVQEQDLDPGDATATATALRQAYSLGTRRVVLISDGLAVPEIENDLLLAEARSAIRRGVRIDTIGLGFEDDATVMFALAAESGGLVVMK